MAGATPRTFRLADLPGDVSLSGVARGDLLYRGADKWSNLAPGTSGYFLRSNGAGADPSWASVIATPSGENGQIQYNEEGAFAGAQRLKYQPRGSIFTVYGGGTDVPLTVDAPAGQAGNLLTLKVNGTTVGAINSAGTLTKTTITGSTNTVYADFKNQSGVSCWKITEAGGLSVGAVTTLLASAQATLSTSNGSITLAVGGNTDANNIITLLSPGTLVSDTLASAIALRVRGTTSQSGSLIQLQGQSSTTAGTAQAEVDTAWNDSTHATRSADLILRAYYTTTAREGLRIRGGSSDVQLGFYGVTPISRAVLATGAGATVDNVITALQNLGLVMQS